VPAQQVVQPTNGSADRWTFIGHTHADLAADHDTIVVKGPLDSFRRSKFEVTEAPLKLYRRLVTYDNSVPDKIEVRQNIPNGGEGRVIDLRSKGKRSVRKIEFWYDTPGLLRGRADLTILGMKSSRHRRSRRIALQK
jgi:hypothetical protein